MKPLGIATVKCILSPSCPLRIYPAWFVLQESNCMIWTTSAGIPPSVQSCDPKIKMRGIDLPCLHQRHPNIHGTHWESAPPESPSFCSPCCNWNSMELELEVFVFIQTLSSILSTQVVKIWAPLGSSWSVLLIFSTKISLFPIMELVVWFFISSSSTSSVIECLGVFFGSNASCASFLVRARGWIGGPLYLMLRNHCLVPSFHQEILPVLQLISGLFLFSQEKPRIILCFSRPVTSSHRSICLSLIFTVSSMKDVIIPCLFFVPSTLRVLWLRET